MQQIQAIHWILCGFIITLCVLVPKEIKVSTTAEKGKNPTIILESIDKQLIGQVAAKIARYVHQSLTRVKVSSLLAKY